MHAILNFASGTYEAIIAIFVVLGLIQAAVIARKSNLIYDLFGRLAAKDSEAVTLKADARRLATSAAKSIIDIITASVKEIAKHARAAQEAKAELQAVMEAAADEDDAADNARSVDPYAAFADALSAPYGARTRSPARNDEDELRRLFGLLDGGRNGRALDDLIFGEGNSPRNPNVRIVNGGDLIHGRPRGGCKVGTIADLIQTLGGQGMLDIKIVGPTGREVTGVEKESLLRTFFAKPGHPTFDDIEAGTRLHDEIERGLRDHDFAPEAEVAAATSEAARDFGPDSGQQGERGGKHDPAYGRPDESCSTQQPHSYANSSPRAG